APGAKRLRPSLPGNSSFSDGDGGEQVPTTTQHGGVSPNPRDGEAPAIGTALSSSPSPPPTSISRPTASAPPPPPPLSGQASPAAAPPAATAAVDDKPAVGVVYPR
ncbi:unnamed protein product, partial [Ectocarpus sp. 8 AP-2014]